MDTAAIDKSFKQLFEVLKEVITYKRRKNMTKPNAIHKCFRDFMDVYGSLDDEEKSDIISQMVKTHGKKILTGNDEWLLEDAPSMGMGKLKIYLGSFYNDATKFKLETEKELEGKDDSAYENRWELNYAPRIRLYVYRILQGYCSDEDTKKIYKRMVRDVENELDIETGENIQTGSKAPGNDMFKVMSDMLSKISMGTQKEGEEGTATPDHNQLASMVGQIFGSPETQDTIGSAMKGMENIKTPQDLMGQMGSMMGKVMEDPTLIKLVSGMVDGVDPTKRSSDINQIRNELPDPDELISGGSQLIKNTSEEGGGVVVTDEITKKVVIDHGEVQSVEQSEVKEIVYKTSE
jgi:hypothetical protein